jgi:metallo-beta-lactamase family protein
MNVTFFSGAKTVTGANYLLEHNGLKFLVDCGMLQGVDFVEEFNYLDFLYDPADIDYLFLTHGHIDHMGRIPKLVRDGFKGKIIATEPTVDLAMLSLTDSARIVREEAKELGREPFYTIEDVKATEKYFVKHTYGDTMDLGSGVKVEIFSAGHVLGSAMYKFSFDDKSITFTGDLGNSPAPLIGPPEEIGHTDYLVIESAYGDRKHQPANLGAKFLREVVVETINRGGTLMIPSFALERTQILLYYLNNLIESGEIKRVPIYVDSPLAQKMTKVYKKYDNYLKMDLQSQIKSGDQIFDFPGLEMSETVEESKAINQIKPPKIIIAGNGMSTAGRILHHEKRYLSDPKNTILIVGYQVKNSIGRQILDGKDFVRIHHQTIDVEADVHQISSFSAHADNPQLIHFVQRNIENRPKKIFVVQGEENAAWQLAQDLNDHGYDALAPDYKNSFEL